MSNANAARKIENLIADRYDANALNCSALVVEWAAGVMAETDGAAAAGKEWRRVNRRREKLGVYTTIPQWGTPLYQAYFA